MKKLTIDECIEIRFEILKEFDKLCKKHKLNYSLAYGTLLGAIREKGMIPWDDDIDVMMPRSDFDKLESIANQINDGPYKFITHRLRKEILTKIGYYIDYRTISIFNNKPKDYLCIHIDIYPVDQISLKHAKNPFFKLKRFWYQSISRGKSLHPELKKGPKRVLYSLIKTFFAPFNEGKALDKLNKLCSKSTEKAQKAHGKVYSSVLVEVGKIILLPEKVFEKMNNYLYEKEYYPCTGLYDQCLSAWYGEYMVPPPNSKRVRPSDNKLIEFFIK